MSPIMTAVSSPGDQSLLSEATTAAEYVSDSSPDFFSGGACPQLFKSSSSPSLPALLLPHHSSRDVLSLVRGQSNDYSKAEALSKALAEEVAPLTSTEQELVRETWTMLESNLADNGIALYLR